MPCGCVTTAVTMRLSFGVITVMFVERFKMTGLPVAVPPEPPLPALPPPEPPVPTPPPPPVPTPPVPPAPPAPPVDPFPFPPPQAAPARSKRPIALMHARVRGKFTESLLSFMSIDYLFYARYGRFARPARAAGFGPYAEDDYDQIDPRLALRLHPDHCRRFFRVERGVRQQRQRNANGQGRRGWD